MAASPRSLLQDILALCDATGMSPTAVGRALTGDPALVGKMQRGRVPGPELEARIRAGIARLAGERLARACDARASLRRIVNDVSRQEPST